MRRSNVSKRPNLLFYHKNLGAGGAERCLLEVLSHLADTEFNTRLLLGREMGALLKLANPQWLVHTPDYKPSAIERLLRRLDPIRFDATQRFRERCFANISRLLPPQQRNAFHKYATRMASPEVLYRLSAAIRSIQPEVLITNLVETAHFPTLLVLSGLASESTPWPKWVAVEQNNTLARLKDHYPDNAECELWATLTRLVYSRCDRVVAISEGVRDGLVQDFGVPSEKIVVIKNPVSLASVQAASTHKTERKYILSAGRLHSQKRQDHLIRAFAYATELSNTELWIAGDGPEEKSLSELASRLGVRDRVQFLGVRNDLWSLMKSAECFVLTSSYEGFGMVLTEAMAAGCPVVSYDIDYGPREFIDDGINGRLIQDGNIEQMSAALVELTSHASMRSAFAERALLDVQQFDTLVVAEKYRSLLTCQLSETA